MLCWAKSSGGLINRVEGGEGVVLLGITIHCLKEEKAKEGFIDK